jgi:hypothetical protein
MHNQERQQTIKTPCTTEWNVLFLIFCLVARELNKRAKILNNVEFCFQVEWNSCEFTESDELTHLK